MKMSDLYTCSVCGLKIDLENLTEHVLLHEEYSAFTYNETSRVIEPLINSEEEQGLQIPVESGDAPIEVIRSDFPAVTAYQTPNANYHTIPVGNPVSLYESNFVPNDGFVETEKTYESNANIEAPLRQENAEYAGSVCLDSVGSLSGIRLIANAAESLSRTNDEHHIDNHPNSSNINNISRNSEPISIQRPLNPGDIIDTICLPYLGSTDSERLFCECSIVFNRFVTEANSQPTTVSSAQSFPQYRNFYTHTYNNNGGVSLQDIVDEDTESDNGYELGDSNSEGESLVSRLRRLTRQGGITPGHDRSITPRGSRAGYKMKVYQYKEPLVKSDVKKELSKNVVPELLKNPAVAKYLEKMNESSDNETDEINDEPLINPTEKDSTDVSKGNKGEVGRSVDSLQNRETEADVFPKTNEKETLVATEPFQDTNVETVQSVPFVSNSGDNCNLHIECDEEGIKIICTKPNVIVENTDVPGDDILTLGDQEGTEGHGEEITETRNATVNEQNVESVIDLEEATSYMNIEVSEEDTLSCSESNMDSEVNKEQQRGTQLCREVEDGSLNVRSNELTVVSSDIKERLENSICEEIESFKDELFYCMLCDVILPSKPKLKKHMQEHRLEKPIKENIVKLDGTYACEDLPEYGNEDLESGDNTEEMEYEMDDLQQEVDDLEHGLIIEKNGGRRRSKRRSDPFWVKENMLKKMRKKGSTRKAFICDNCGDSFDFVFDNLKHVARCVVQTNQLKCFQGCGQVFKTKSELDYHKNFCSRRIAYREKMYDIFEKIKKSAGDDFMDYIDPSLHLDDESKLITCRNCDEVFTFEELCIHSADCKRESRLAEVKNEDIYECQYCQRTNFSSEKNRLHELVCKKRPMQKCDYCDFSCKGSKPMSIHLVSQHNVNPYQCEFCPKTFKLKSSLKSHVKYAHTKETITCEYCGKSFCKQSIYRSHVSIQHEGFRFLCRYCDKPFKDKRTWLTHENSHKGAYDYACSVCKKTFNKSSKYKDHMKEFHSIDGEAALVLNSTARELRDKLCTNICNVCGEKFPLKSAYSHHMVKEHGVLVDE